MKKALVIITAVIMVMMVFTMVVGTASAESKWVKTSYGKYKIDIDKQKYQYHMNSGWKYQMKWTYSWPDEGGWIIIHGNYNGNTYMAKYVMEIDDDGTWSLTLVQRVNSGNGPNLKIEDGVPGLGFYK